MSVPRLAQRVQKRARNAQHHGANHPLPEPWGPDEAGGNPGDYFSSQASVTGVNCQRYEEGFFSIAVDMRGLWLGLERRRNRGSIGANSIGTVGCKRSRGY